MKCFADKQKGENFANRPLEVIAVGDAFVDLIAKTPRFPPRGGNVWGEAVKMSPGGTCANFAVAISRLGIKSGFVGSLGDDIYGHFLLEDFVRERVDVSHVKIDDSAYTGIVFAVVDDEGERTFFACGKGAAHTRLAPEDIDPAYFAQARAVHITGVSLLESPSREALLTAMKEARAKGVRVSFDPNLRLEGDVFPPELLEAIQAALRLSDLVLIADYETVLIFGTTDFGEAAHRILELGSALAVVKLGSQGAMGVSREGKVIVSAFKVQVVDTTGAGDAFDAGFLAARVRGLALKDALTYANAVAAISTTKKGARAIPTHSEVEAFIKSNAG